MSSPTKPTTCIEDLPPEMIFELFEYLHPKDLAACSLVNKRWHSIYAAFKLHRLAAIDFQLYPYEGTRYYKNSKWYHSNRPFQEAELCRPVMFCDLAETPLLSNLKHLALTDSFGFDLNKLNRFQQLVHLEIDTRPAGQVHLNLPRLRVLAFHYFNDRCALSINCPLLSTLKYYEEGYTHLLKVKHPETIRVLETNLVDQQLAPFKNVECLVTSNFKAINKATLLSLPRLRELHDNRSIERVFREESSHGIGTADRMKRTLSEFVDQAKKLRGGDFQFTFAGFHPTNVNVNQIDFGVQVDESRGRERLSEEYVYMKNYHLIKPGALHFVQRVRYNDLLNQLTGEFPRCFSEKFTGIETVEVNGLVKDPDHLLWFLKSLRSLRCLGFTDAELSQEFYDQLPASARSLVCLDLRGTRKDRKELRLNFDFTCEFPRLSSLVITHRSDSFDSFASIIRSFAKLVVTPRFYIFLKENSLWVEKERGSTVWMITTFRGMLIQAENPDEIVNFLEELSAKYRQHLLSSPD